MNNNKSGKLKVWIESDRCGTRKVMVYDPKSEEPPFAACTFHCHPVYADRDTTLTLAEEMAVKLGASQPVGNIEI